MSPFSSFAHAVVAVGLTLAACGPAARFEGSEPGDCSDEADNDLDGTFDCEDLGCAGAPVCVTGLDSGPGPLRPDGGLDAGRDAGVLLLTDGGRDGGPRDAGHDASTVNPECDFNAVGRNIGSACRGGVCASGLMCEREQSASAPSVLPDGTPGPAIPITFNPGGLCTVSCASDGECNSCSLCAGTAANPGVCLAQCTPTRTDTGGCRAGWACSLGGTCNPECLSDDFCKIVGVTTSGSAYIYDPTSPAVCNSSTRRCQFRGTSAVAGDACVDDFDCNDDGLCITGAAWPGGYCARLGCEFPGFECTGAGETCDTRNFGVSICMRGCDVAAEPASDELGARGHGQGCAPGFACTYNGATGTSNNGSCIPGEYNTVTAPNIGASCGTDAECYSPLGQGRCLFADPSLGIRGYCAVSGCVAMMSNSIFPGVATDVVVCDQSAGSGSTCVNFGTAIDPAPTCVASCVTGDDCAAGFACANILAGGAGVCWPTCLRSVDGSGTVRDADDCRVGETCFRSGTRNPCDADGPDNTLDTADDQTCMCSP